MLCVSFWPEYAIQLHHTIFLIRYGEVTKWNALPDDLSSDSISRSNYRMQDYLEEIEVFVFLTLSAITVK